MIHATETTRTAVTAPTTPTERAVFRSLEIGPAGARVTFPVGPSLLCLVLHSSAEAAVLEEVGRLARLRLAEQEQLAVQLEQLHSPEPRTEARS